MTFQTLNQVKICRFLIWLAKTTDGQSLACLNKIYHDQHRLNALAYSYSNISMFECLLHLALAQLKKQQANLKALWKY